MHLHTSTVINHLVLPNSFNQQLKNRIVVFYHTFLCLYASDAESDWSKYCKIGSYIELPSNTPAASSFVNIHWLSKGLTVQWFPVRSTTGWHGQRVEETMHTLNTRGFGDTGYTTNLIPMEGVVPVNFMDLSAACPLTLAVLGSAILFCVKEQPNHITITF